MLIKRLCLLCMCLCYLYLGTPAWAVFSDQASIANASFQVGTWSAETSPPQTPADQPGILNGDFSQSLTGWLTEGTVTGAQQDLRAIGLGQNSHVVQLAVIGEPGGHESAIAQNIETAKLASSFVTFSYNLKVKSDLPELDEAVFIVTAQNQVVFRQNRSQADQISAENTYQSGWRTAVIDLHNFPNQTVQLRFSLSPPEQSSDAYEVELTQIGSPTTLDLSQLSLVQPELELKGSTPTGSLTLAVPKNLGCLTLSLTNMTLDYSPELELRVSQFGENPSAAEWQTLPGVTILSPPNRGSGWLAALIDSQLLFLDVALPISRPAYVFARFSFAGQYFSPLSAPIFVP